MPIFECRASIPSLASSPANGLLPSLAVKKSSPLLQLAYRNRKGLEMISLFTVATAAFLTAGLTLYSGFGLGTLLMPVFALFFPIEVAVAATAIVHGANNLFKISMVGKNADWSLVLRFGIPAIAASLLGAYCLGYVSHFAQLASYSIGSRTAVITPVKLVMGLLMLIFATFELIPRLRNLQFDRKYLIPGGLVSGFFGGFSGHQGALRSAFLIKVGVSTQAFVGTNAVIGTMVDITRIAAYVVVFLLAGADSLIEGNQWPLILAAVMAAFAGVITGKRYLHKITMKTVQTLTGSLLLAIALALGSGLI